MRFSSPVRTDLVISMTLAETFLLLLFVVWYGHTAILRQDPVALMKERLTRLERENTSLTKELKDAKDKIADLKFRLDLWYQLTGFETPPPPPVFIEWRKEACRSNPKCERNNVLVHASVVGGRISMQWLIESPKLSQWLANGGRRRPALGAAITDPAMIQSFLEAVWDYYPNAKVNGTECRFDYRLTYGSKEDYYDGRELFERYFFPAGLNRVGTDRR